MIYKTHLPIFLALSSNCFFSVCRKLFVWVCLFLTGKLLWLVNIFFDLKLLFMLVCTVKCEQKVQREGTNLHFLLHNNSEEEGVVFITVMWHSRDLSWLYRRSRLLCSEIVGIPLILKLSSAKRSKWLFFFIYIRSVFWISKLPRHKGNFQCILQLLQP